MQTTFFHVTRRSLSLTCLRVDERERESRDGPNDFLFVCLVPAYLKRGSFKQNVIARDNFSKSTFDLYKMFKIDSEEIIQLDDYFLEYFIRLLKRLRDINFEDVQKQKNLVI